MARRKRGFMEDGLDSSGGSDSGMDDADNASGFNKKRRRRGWESDEDEDEENIPTKRADWAKAPAFVSGGNKDEDNMDEDMAIDEEGLEETGGYEDEEENEDEDEDTVESPSIPQADEDEDMDDVQPRISGIGMGSAKSGLGSSKPNTSTPSFTQSSSSSVPSTFSSTTRSTSFLRDPNASKPPPTLPPAERAHFSKISSGIGARLLAKMGWQAGTGLGASGEGIVTPIESKLRPERSGIAFQGFKEKTEQSKMEARRRGEEVSDDEDEKVRKAKRKVREVKEKRSEAWKKPKKVKTKVEHKTYEQIIAEAGAPSVSSVGQIIDATGAVPREVSSLADVSLNSWTPSSDPTRIPEVRHNIRIITDACKSDLDGLAREAKSLDERKKLAVREDLRLRKQVEEEAERISRLQQVQLVATEISATSKQLASVYEVSLDPLSPLFYRLGSEFAPEVEVYRLDEIVVAAIAPLIRRLVADWNPLQDPSTFMSTFRNWRPVLRINIQTSVPQDQVDVYGARTTVAASVDSMKPMTPFESLLWNVWLPKVRSSVNNEWDPTDPQPALKLYEAWSTFLPPFIRDNLLDQLILPKVQKAVAEWKPKQSGGVSLQMIVFPWLPHVGLRMEDVIGDARRKMKSLLRSWNVGDPVPTDLGAWQQVFSTKDWDNMLLKYIVPKLSSTLRTDFRINPRNQSMAPFHNVLHWSPLLRSSIFSQILLTEFFPKWLDVLHIWLVQPNVSFGEVAQWYQFWKDEFPEDVRGLEDVQKGFTCGLDLMNKAIALGKDAPTKLAKPQFPPPAPTSKAATEKAKAPTRPSARTQEITFRSIVEEYVASNNLLFIPAGKVHERSRMPLYRVSPTADGKGGLLVYVLDDAVWASKEGGGGTEEEYRAISLDEMIARASQ